MDRAVCGKDFRQIEGVSLLYQSASRTSHVDLASYGNSVSASSGGSKGWDKSGAI